MAVDEVCQRYVIYIQRTGTQAAVIHLQHHFDVGTLVAHQHGHFAPLFVERAFGISHLYGICADNLAYGYIAARLVGGAYHVEPEHAGCVYGGRYYPRMVAAVVILGLVERQATRGCAIVAMVAAG